MKTTPFFSNPVELSTGTSLTSLLDQLAAQMAPLVRQSKSVFVNEIEPAFFTAAREENIRPVLEAIIDSLFACARHGKIHVSAEKIGRNVQVLFEERNNYNGYALAFRLCGVEHLAREAGGYLYVKDEKSLKVRVGFCFPDTAQVPEMEY